ncbi:MAG: hypothetical protein ACM3PC_02080 [Deltaproteobacteria bacterium]
MKIENVTLAPVNPYDAQESMVKVRTEGLTADKNYVGVWFWSDCPHHQIPFTFKYTSHEPFEFKLDKDHLKEHHPAKHPAVLRIFADEHMIEKEFVVETEQPAAVKAGGLAEARSVSLQRSAHPHTWDEALWVMIRLSTDRLRYPHYAHALTEELRADRDLSFKGIGAYKKVRRFTERFVAANCGVPPEGTKDHRHVDNDEVIATELERFGMTHGEKELEALWAQYERHVAHKGVTPYYEEVGKKAAAVAADGLTIDEYETRGNEIVEKLGKPCLIELIWAYFHELGMLVQTMNAVSVRFQNKSAGPGDPLANMEIAPLRPLNNLLWGYVQSEQDRLTVERRAYEYRHQYGLTMQGKAVAGVHAADERSKFLEAFHLLLHEASHFFVQDDQTTVVADAFPVLNAMKAAHYVLAQGAHNQFGDLPATARQEMLIQQWLLAQPQMREFLGGRMMVPYPEAWMDRVDNMKTLYGWPDVSIVHFHDLARFGEQILLSIRHGRWSKIDDPAVAANWARYWRPEIQGYIHAYRAVTGIDLTPEVVEPQLRLAWALPPVMHIRHRITQRVQ